MQFNTDDSRRGLRSKFGSDLNREWLNLLPYKIAGSYLQKCLSYGHYSVIWFGFAWVSALVLSICTALQNLGLLASKMPEL